MNLRGQILLGSILLAVLPLAVAVPVIRSGVQDRLAGQDTQRVEDQMSLVREDIEGRDGRLSGALESLAESAAADNRFRLALAGGGDLDAYLRDYAGRHMSLLDLDMLQIQDENGSILSSGHYREAFGENAPRLPRLLANAPDGSALMTVRTPGETVLMLGRGRELAIGGARLHLIGGIRFEETELAALGRDEDVGAALVWPGGSLTTRADLAERLETLADPARRAEALEFLLRADGQVVRTHTWRLIDQGQPGEITLLVAHDRSTLHALLRELDLRIGAILVLAVALAIVLAVLLAGRISRPLRDLADRTEELDLDRLDADFTSTRRDEVGRLARLLGEMIERLRAGVTRLRDAEHRATLGEVARQVNHDIRNGLTPLRNVLRHLDEVAANEPEKLGTVFRERKATLDGGLAYLEELAAHYSRLSPGREPRPCRLDRIAAEALAGPPARPGLKLANLVPVNLPAVEADPISLRRIFDNLVRNAIEALPPAGGLVQIGAHVAEDEHLEEPRVVVEVTDTGGGIPAENLDRIFTDFFTTREGGTGLGLSNVRRLAADCGATVKVGSEPGQGTTFTLSFPLPPNRDQGT